MADEAQPQATNGVPPAGEPIHLPGPSYLPVLVAAGATIALVGVVLNWFLVAGGMAIVVICVLRWISQVRREMDELPLEH